MRILSKNWEFTGNTYLGMGLKPIQIPDKNTVEKADDFLKGEKTGPSMGYKWWVGPVVCPFSIFRQIR